MVIEFETGIEDKIPALPDPLGHEANELGLRFTDAESSRKNREAKYRGKLNHPVHRKVREAAESRMIYLYILCALFLPVTLYWEWVVSREIYEVRLATEPIIPYLVFVGLAFIAGALFAEVTPMFSIFPPGHAGPEDRSHRLVEVLYGRKRRWRPERKTLCLMGAIVTTLMVLIPIYIFSQERVIYLKQAGELKGELSQVDIWLPVALYGLEILLGMPTFFLGLAFIHYISMKREARKLTREIDMGHELRKLTIETYFRYMNALVEYNRAAGNGTRERFLIPPNKALRDLLTAQYGYDPTRSQGPETDQPSNTGEGSAPGEAEAPNSRQRTGQEEQQRVDDLLTLVDQQIDTHNRNL